MDNARLQLEPHPSQQREALLTKTWNTAGQITKILYVLRWIGGLFARILRSFSRRSERQSKVRTALDELRCIEWAVKLFEQMGIPPGAWHPSVRKAILRVLRDISRGDIQMNGGRPGTP